MTTLEIQKLLNKNGFSLKEDGKSGASTIKAIKDFQKSKGLTIDGKVGTQTIEALMHKISTISSKKRRIRTQAEVIKEFGQPGENQVILTLPYKMIVSWDKKSTVSKVQCHKKMVEPFTKVFEELLSSYGYQELHRLEIDVYGGIYNFRKMRTSNSWSRHSWGIAIDLNPEKNALRTPWNKSQFSKPEYKPMIDIFYKHGFINLGLESNMDAMHWEYGI